MSDRSPVEHAQTVREALGAAIWRDEGMLLSLDANAALDALVALAEGKPGKQLFTASADFVSRLERAEQERDKFDDEAERLGVAKEEWRRRAEAAEEQLISVSIVAKDEKERADDAEAQAERYEQALRGWEVRGSNDQQYHSVERGTITGRDWEQIVEGLSYEQAEAIEDFLRAALAESKA